MSTIAFDGKWIAFDQMAIGPAGAPTYGAQKVVPTEGAVVFAGGCGMLDGVRAFQEWACAGMEDPYPQICSDLVDECTYFTISEGGIVSLYERRSVFVTKQEAPAAFGSGSQFAMGAMLAGSDAREAVRIAIELDTNSGGEVVAMKL